MFFPQQLQYYTFGIGSSLATVKHLTRHVKYLHRVKHEGIKQMASQRLCVIIEKFGEKPPTYTDLPRPFTLHLFESQRQ